MYKCALCNDDSHDVAYLYIQVLEPKNLEKLMSISTESTHQTQESITI
jgi:hypothetical protein